MGRAVFTGRVTIAGHVVPKIDPLMIAQGRTTIALLILAPFLLIRNRSALKVRGWRLAQFFPLGVLGLAASNYFYYLAIERTSVATAIVLQMSPRCGFCSTWWRASCSVPRHSGC